MAMERQQSWGWQVTADVFAGGIGAGLFLVSFLFEQIYGSTPLTIMGTIVGPSLVLVGIFFLLAEVSKPFNALRAFLNLGTSWMSRGVVLQPMLIALGLVYALLPLGFPGIKTAVAGIVIGSLGALLALLVTVYHGLLLSQAKGIALWNNNLLPMLYFVSALAGGTGILLLLSPFYSASPNQLGALAITEVALVCLVLISLWLMVAVRPTSTYRQSLKNMITPSFVGLTLVAGNLVPLVALITGALTDGALASILFATSGALVLIGTYHLRHATMTAGHYYSLQV